MHGLIFVTWEKFLDEQFGRSSLNRYRELVGETMAARPWVSRVYDDATLLDGVNVACELTHHSADTLLRAYGRYFILNELTSHLCAYLLTQVHSSRELLLVMSAAHAQMRCTTDALLPPLFRYESFSSNLNEFVLLYESSRQLCPLVLGAIEGAAELYKEQVQVVERTCMKHGAADCRFEVRFPAVLSEFQEQRNTPLQARRQSQRQMVDLVWNALPDADGVTLAQLQTILQDGQVSINPHSLRPSVLLQALFHLQYAGLINTTASQPGDNLTQRRYWRTSTQQAWLKPAWRIEAGVLE